MGYKINHNNSVGCSTKTNPGVIITQTFEDFAPPPPPRDSGGEIILPSMGFGWITYYMNFSFGPLLTNQSVSSGIAGALMSAYYSGAEMPEINYRIIYPSYVGGIGSISVWEYSEHYGSDYMSYVVDRSLPFINPRGSTMSSAQGNGKIIRTFSTTGPGPGIIFGTYFPKGSNNGFAIRGVASGVFYDLGISFSW